MTRVVIIEDESYAVKRLQTVLREIAPDITIQAVLSSIEEAVRWFRKSPVPDLVFLDVHLSDGDCFQIFHEIEPVFPVIFITAYDQYAIQAFQVNGIDYLLKPVKKEEMKKSLAKFRNIHKAAASTIDYKSLQDEIRGLSRTFQKRILIRYGQKITTVDIPDIAYFYADGKVNFLCTFGNKQLPVDQSLDELQKILDPSVFFRINRKLIIHSDSIASMYSYSRSRMKLILNPGFSEDVVVSTDRTPGFKQWLTGATGSGE